MTSTVNGRLDKEELYQDILNRIQSNPNKEAELSATDLAKKYKVSGPSIDHHLNKFVETGKLQLSSKKGRYNRKIYRLPADFKATEETQTSNDTSVDDMEKFKGFLEQSLLKLQQDADVKEVSQTSKPETIERTEVLQTSNPETIERTELLEIPIMHYEDPKVSIDEPIDEAAFPEPIIEVIENVQEKELTLDDKIQHFINETNKVHDANVLLNHEDREILSVMNETLNQTIIYFKDLTEQLSTVQNKELIQNLIDDRNRMQKEITRLQEEAEIARIQSEKTKDKYEIKPERVRFMQQMIISTIEDYLNLKNQSLATQRTSFFNKVSKEISDLARYALRLEK